MFMKCPRDYTWPRTRRRIIHEHNHARNKPFQLPAFPTANQILWHCSNSQSALRSKSGRNEHKLVIVCIRPNFSGSRYRECMRTAQIGPDLRLLSKIYSSSSWHLFTIMFFFAATFTFVCRGSIL